MVLSTNPREGEGGGLSLGLGGSLFSLSAVEMRKSHRESGPEP